MTTPRAFGIMAFSALATTAPLPSFGLGEPVTVHPTNTDEALVNPGMGFYFYQYSNRLWAYGSQQKPGDTLDWFPGCSTIYFRLPWCELEPEEGDYRWDLIDTYAVPWIAKGKRIAFRITTCENRYVYPTPKWVFDAGAKCKAYNMHDFAPNWTDETLYEPVYTDPVYLGKLEKFLKAFAARYDGKPYVDFIDIGSFGLWGEGHTFYTSKLDSKQTLETVKIHMDLWRRCLPNSYLVICDDVGFGAEESVNDDWIEKPDCEAMQYARKLGIGFRDDSVMVWKAPKQYQRDNWARLFAPFSPVIVEHDHYVLTQRPGIWDDKWLVGAIKAYRASWMSIHGFPEEYLRERADVVKEANKILGYRFELREAVYPSSVEIGEKFTIKAKWANVGVAKCYRGGFAAWSILDKEGNVVWSCVDEANNFSNLPPAYDGAGEQPRTFKSGVRLGCTSELPRRNDGVLKYLNRKGMTFGKRIPTISPGEYSLCISVGSRDGVPEIALPLEGERGRRYPLGKITVREAAAQDDRPQASVKVDFSKAVGPVKPVNGVGQPPMIGKLRDWSMIHFLKEAGIPYSRLHDVGGWLGGGLFVDIPALFPNFDADENDPKSYRFAYTDSLLKALDKNGVEPFFRLGVTIENFAAHDYPPLHILPPKDFAKWGRICEHVIRHYTEGWADGLKLKLTYWEIWNEPDSNPDFKRSPMWQAPFSEYIRLYGIVAPYLKEKFPHLKFGGYAGCGFYAGVGSDHVPAANSSPRTQHFVDCFHQFLAAVRDNNWPLDFFSYHSYSDPAEAMRQVRFADEVLNSYGFTADKCERIYDEWLPYAGSIKNLGTAKQATGVAAELIGLQNGPCNVACIYDARCGVGNYSPLFNPLTYQPHKAYYAFVAFNALRKRGTAVAVETTGDKNLWATAAKGEKDAVVMMANDSDEKISLCYDFQGRSISSCRITDKDRTYAPCKMLQEMPPRSFVVIVLE